MRIRLRVNSVSRPLIPERPGRVAATSEPRDRRSCKTAPQPYGIGVGDEYADGDRQTPMMTSRLTGDRQAPTDAVIVSQWRRDPFFHAAKREQDATWSLRLCYIAEPST